tara:strand:+ start:88673 stop:88906 length:234 start_codon:yes stop_codon:yes gene_type:complete
VLAALAVLALPNANGQSANGDAAAQEPATRGETDSGGDSAPRGADGNSPAPDETSPFDYEASEEISEDLSVSFPVDI